MRFLKNQARSLSNLDKETILLIEDMEGTGDPFTLNRIATVAYNSGSGGGVTRVQSYVFEGQYAMQIASGTVADGGYEAFWDLGRIRKSQRLGFEFWFLTAFMSDHELLLGIEFMDGTNKNRVDVRIEKTGVLQYLGSAGSYIDTGITYQPSFGGNFTWHNAKIVADFSDGKPRYVRASVDDKDLTPYLSGHLGYSSASVACPNCNRYYVIHKNGAAVTTSRNMFLDYFILTADER